MYISTSKPSSETLYGIDYGLKVGGIVDNTPQLNNFMAACKAQGKKGELPMGVMNLLSKPNTIDFPWSLSGQSNSYTRFLRSYNETVDTRGCFEITASGGRFKAFGIDAASGTTGGSLISVVSVVAGPTGSISDLVFEDMTNSTFGNNTHKYTMYIDGSATPSAPMNDIALRNVLNYGAENMSVFVKSVQEFSWIGGGCYTAGGTYGSVDITGTAGNKSYYTRIDLTSITGTLYLTQCEWGVVTICAIGGATSVANDNTCRYFKTVIGRNAGTLQTNWLNSTYL